MLTKGANDHIGHRIIREIRQNKANTKPNEVRLSADEREQLVEIRASREAFLSSLEDIAAQEMADVDFSALGDTVYTHKAETHPVTGRITDLNPEAASFDGQDYFGAMSFKDPALCKEDPNRAPPFFEGSTADPMYTLLATIDDYATSQRYGLIGSAIDEVIDVLSRASKSRSEMTTVRITSIEYRKLNHASKMIRDNERGAQDAVNNLGAVIEYAITRYGLNLEHQAARWDGLYVGLTEGEHANI